VNEPRAANARPRFPLRWFALTFVIVALAVFAAAAAGVRALAVADQSIAGASARTTRPSRKRRR
jgi:hypothetical protein